MQEHATACSYISGMRSENMPQRMTTAYILHPA
jgi:hypothetical protein